MLINSLVLALSGSLDSIGVGISYGIKKTKVGILSFLVLFTLIFAVTTISMLFGNFITSIVSETFVSIIGAIMLLGMGIFIIYSAIFNKKEKNSKNSLSSSIHKEYNFFIKFLGITINIIKNPVSSDIDNSNIIDIHEALFLGTALSLDAISIGFGASVIGINSLVFPFFMSLFHLIFLYAGIYVGEHINNISKLPSNILSVISGILLICLSLLKLFIF